MNILVNVINQKLKIKANTKRLVSGTQKFIRFEFNLDDAWDNLLVFAQFIQNGKAYNDYLDENNSVYLPPEIVDGKFNVLLYGSGSNVIATTNYLTFEVDKNMLISDAQSTEITESLYNKLVNIVKTYVSQSASGAPTPVPSSSLMTDPATTYLYTGSEDGYIKGDWYYFSNGELQHGGTYGVGVTDSSLTIEGAAADAYAVGVQIDEIKDVLDEVTEECVNILDPSVLGTGTVSGVTITKQSDALIFNGTATADNLIESQDIPLLSGEQYAVNVYTNSQHYINYLFNFGGDTPSASPIYTSRGGLVKITIPSGTTSVRIGIGVVQGETYSNDEYRFSIQKGQKNDTYVKYYQGKTAIDSVARENMYTFNDTGNGNIVISFL